MTYDERAPVGRRMHHLPRFVDSGDGAPVDPEEHVAWLYARARPGSRRGDGHGHDLAIRLAPEDAVLALGAPRLHERDVDERKTDEDRGDGDGKPDANQRTKRTNAHQCGDLEAQLKTGSHACGSTNRQNLIVQRPRLAAMEQGAQREQRIQETGVERLVRQSLPELERRSRVRRARGPSVTQLRESPGSPDSPARRRSPWRAR